MTGVREPQDASLPQLVALLDEACAVIEQYRPPAARRKLATGDPTSLLEQCLALCSERDRRAPDPIRTLHHFACTGGTLVGKCLAAMPNVQLLSEVDPLSTMQHSAGTARFAPTDLIQLVRQSTRGASDALLARMFSASLSLVAEDCARRGLRLVLRDHAHSHYCTGDGIPTRPGLRELAAESGVVVSAVTVRHPLDSYLSLVELGWVQFQPPGFDEYCRRYVAFLADHDGLHVMRYEDFIAAPERELQRLCHVLALEYRPGFEDLFGLFRLTGDSGRGDEVIAPRPGRPVPQGLAGEISQASHYGALLERLGYSHR